MSAKVAKIVATLELTAHGSDINQTLFTPASAGLFRLSLYAELDTSGTIHANYVDDASNSITLTAAGATNVKTFNNVFRSAASQAISISTAIDSFPFNLYAVLEELSD
jgi:hypothetical protein